MSDFYAARRAMVDCQVRPSDVTRFAIIGAMLDVPRELFVPRAQRPVAYGDLQVEIAPGRVMLDPRTFAKMLDAADIRDDDLVLDVGAGSGYSSVVAARMAAAVVALEEDPALAAQAAERIAGLEVDNVIVETGPLAGGHPASGPYDVILVEGAIETEPHALLDQLKVGGRLVAIHMSGALGQCRIYTRAAGSASFRNAFDASAPVLPGFNAVAVFEF